ncbi:MAG: hypothetical protein QOD06_789 [Candidatus Binatota bacterium]|nr:hypothetical protein [Candidatus Binatota bacterium]
MGPRGELNGRIASFPGGLIVFVLVFAGVRSADAQTGRVRLEQSRIYFEYNSTARDFGVQVSLDGEQWKNLSITRPGGDAIFRVAGKGELRDVGLTELFFEGEEPSLDDVPVDEFLAKFPEGKYRFTGKTVAGEDLIGAGTLSHAVPEGPSNVSTAEANGTLVISWDPVTSSAAGFPARSVEIVGYQVIVDPFQVTLPASATRVTLPPEFFQSLEPGTHDLEVLAIEKSGNQTITESTFDTQ